MEGRTMLPRLIQGGMGAGVSGWPLAREVARLGQLGVVSGTALDTILVRRLAAGDPGGHVRRAIEAFPVPGVGARVLERYSRTGGEDDDGQGPRYKLVPMARATMSDERAWLIVLASFVEVYLAKEGHDGVVGINFLHKIQFPILPGLYGAMLAGVDAVLMGAGIPAEIPGVLDRLARGEAVIAPLDVLEAGDERFQIGFDAAGLCARAGVGLPPVRRPEFLAIVSSATLARALLKKAPGGIAGFVVEAPVAGGHNAPPRGGGGVQQLTQRGEPLYGERDEVNPADMVALGVPFWLAGGFASRAKFEAAIAAGARGIQVGTAFAFCEESGLEPGLRREFIEAALDGTADIFTDPNASPTSFPFKVAGAEGSASEPEVYAERPRLCDLGYLRRAYRKDDGTLGYRCPAEPVEDYVRKGGKAEDTAGRKCLCNGLMTNIGLGQRRADGYEEPALLTAGDDLGSITAFVTRERLSYHAADVVKALMAGV
jgi:NAD(P)H-dependent flavin oxidoreductase YrpB (nitropropane dioxygenase family)